MNKENEHRAESASAGSGAAPCSARCEGWTRHGGAFTLGPVTWKRCENAGIVMLKFKDADTGKVKTLPACKGCWAECLATGITIIEARPIAPNADIRRV